MQDGDAISKAIYFDSGSSAERVRETSRPREPSQQRSRSGQAEMGAFQRLNLGAPG